MRNEFLAGITLAITRACFASVALHADNRILISAEINDTPVRLAFDTGSEGSILFRKAADRIGLKTPVEVSSETGPTGAVRVVTADECWLNFGGVCQKFKFSVFDAPEYQSWDVDGCIAWKSVCARIVSVNAEQGLCTISDRLPSDLSSWVKWQLTANSRLLTFGRTNDKSFMKIGVDTGSDSGVQLSLRQWNRWLAEHVRQPATVEALFTPGDGLIIREVLRAASITLDGVTLVDVPVTSVTSATDQGFEQSDAVLGLFALSRLELLVDGKQGVAYTRPVGSPSQQYDYNRLGAVFVPQDSSSKLVAYVLKGSEADRAGIRNGDRLLKIGELDTTRWRSDPGVLPLHRFWSQPAGTKLRLQLSRNDRTYEATVTLEEISQ